MLTTRVASGNGATHRRAKLLLDPTAARLGPHSFAFGTSPDAAFVTQTDSLVSTASVYVRGIGLSRSDQTLNTGSSGGFLAGQQLVEVRLAGGVHLSIRTSRIALSMENASLDLTNKKAPNCAVPSYCTACSLIGADPPNTYKPCAQARVEGSASGRYNFELELRDSTDQVVYRAQPSPAVNGDLLRYVQIQLYSSPNVPIPPGDYKLIGRLKSGTG